MSPAGGLVGSSASEQGEILKQVLITIGAVAQMLARRPPKGLPLESGRLRCLPTPPSITHASVGRTLEGFRSEDCQPNCSSGLFRSSSHLGLNLSDVGPSPTLEGTLKKSRPDWMRILLGQSSALAVHHFGVAHGRLPITIWFLVRFVCDGRDLYPGLPGLLRAGVVHHLQSVVSNS